MTVRVVVSLALGLLALGVAPLLAQTASCIASPTTMTPAGWITPAAYSPKDPRGTLRLVANVPLPGPANRFDYQSVDPVARRLYISHMNAGRLIVFDLDSSRVVADIGGVDRATGVWAVPAQHKVYVSAAGRHELVALDDRTLKIVARVGGTTCQRSRARTASSSTRRAAARS